MSAFIKGGYSAVSKQFLNITLKPTTVWHTGLLLNHKNKVLSTLHPSKENKLEMIQYNNMTVLLLNNGIIYEDKKFFSYYLEFSLMENDFQWTTKDILASYIDYDYVSVNEIKLN
jgi:hypothetical protein